MKKTLCCLLLATTIGLGGCLDSRVRLSNNVESDLNVKKVVTKRNHDGLLEIHISGENDASKYFKSEYRIVWLDSDGFPLDTLLSKWTPFPVYEGAEFHLSAVAPHPRATDFRIIIRKKED